MKAENGNVTPNTNRGVSLDVVPDLATVDWLTATCRKRETGYDWYEVYKKFGKIEDPEKLSKAPFNKYGYVGEKWGSVTWAEHPKWGVLFIVSGAMANRCWKQIVPSATKTTRIDLAVTVNLDAVNLGVAQNAYKYRPDVKKTIYELRKQSIGGQTLYVGRRVSGEMGRLYDKSAERGDEPGKSWRYEVELKAASAHKFSQLLLKHAKEIGFQDRLIQQFVWEWFDGRGIPPVFKPRVKGKGIQIEKEMTITTTADKKLTWLNTQIRPTVRDLLRAGLGPRVIEALDLVAYLTEHQQTLLIF